MNEILSTLTALLPSKRKTTPSGWISFDAVCCHHRGENHDDRKRGGVIFNGEGFSYHCFNCQFRAGWSPGKLLSSNTKLLFRYLGLSDNDVSKLALFALANKDAGTKTRISLNFELKDVELPEGSLPITSWIDQELDSETYQQLTAIIQYIVDRGLDIDWYNFHWSPASGFQDRVLIPFYQDGRIVGYTGRKITSGKPKYLSESQSGYVFNLDKQTTDRKYIILVEGQIDAIAVDGAAIMTNEPNETQCARIASLGREVIAVPDRDAPGLKLMAAAVKNSWSVSMPPWESDIKDVADAVRKYGRLYTLNSILHYREDNPVKIQILQRQLETQYGKK